MNILPTKTEIDRIESALKEMDILIRKFSIHIAGEKYLEVIESFHRVVKWKKIQYFNDAVKVLPGKG